MRGAERDGFACARAVAGRVKWDVVQEGSSPAERRSNARYVVSVAQKIGCTVFVTWEDIAEVRPRMMLTLVASIMARATRVEAAVETKAAPLSVLV